MKHEWKKHEKNIYGTKRSPALITVPAQNFIAISGTGDPNDSDFSERVAALYGVAYAVKMNYKSGKQKEMQKGCLAEQIDDFTVYPLEGVWKQKKDEQLVKEKLEYTIMIRQPEFITEDMINAALENVKIKKPSPLYKEIRFETIQGGTFIEILHLGAFDDEPLSFAKMDEFACRNGWKRTETSHREIYLNNAKRVSKDKLQTILRYQVDIERI